MRTGPHNLNKVGHHRREEQRHDETINESTQTNDSKVGPTCVAGSHVPSVQGAQGIAATLQRRAEMRRSANANTSVAEALAGRKRAALLVAPVGSCHAQQEMMRAMAFEAEVATWCGTTTELTLAVRLPHREVCAVPACHAQTGYVGGRQCELSKAIAAITTTRNPSWGHTHQSPRTRPGSWGRCLVSHW
jgi:hypothetical protein